MLLLAVSPCTWVPGRLSVAGLMLGYLKEGRTLNTLLNDQEFASARTYRPRQRRRQIATMLGFSTLEIVLSPCCTWRWWGRTWLYIDVGATPNVCLDMSFGATTHDGLGLVNSKPFLLRPATVPD